MKMVLWLNYVLCRDPSAKNNAIKQCFPAWNTHYLYFEEKEKESIAFYKKKLDLI